MPRPRLERDGDIAAPSIDDALGQDGAKLGDGVLMFVRNDLSVVLTVEGSLRRHQLRVLDQDHGRRYKGSLVVCVCVCV